MLDNCQHVLLGCCTNLIDFYRRLGVLDRIQYQRIVHFLDPAGRRYDLFGIRGLPAPLHLGARHVALWRAQLGPAYFRLARDDGDVRLGKGGRQALAKSRSDSGLMNITNPRS